MVVLDGKKTAESVKQALKEEIALLRNRLSKKPKLVTVLVGNNGASETYVASKLRTCEAIGIDSSLIRKEESVSEAELIEVIDGLNKDNEVSGILVQLPLPMHIDEQKITLAIDPEKDVDGFHPVNMGRLVIGMESFIPATPLGILLLLEHYKIDTEGLNALVIGRSAIVGTPMSLLLSRNSNPGNCTVTLAHSRTKNLKEIALKADLIVAALGKPEFLTEDMVKPGAIVIDVGITRIKDETLDKGYRIAGDVDYKSVSEKCSFITPVPGGVGAMTIAALMRNTLDAFKRQNALN